MARRPYVNLVGYLSGWPNTLVPTPATFRNLDQFSSELVNGDEGGAWAPTDPIVIGARGTPTITLGTAGSVLSGDIETVSGNAIGNAIDALPGLILQSSAVPVFQTARTRSIVVPFTTFIEANTAAALNEPRWEVDPVSLGARWIATNTTNANIIATVPMPLRGQHSGATIDSIDFRFAVGEQHAALPSVMPRVRAIKVSGDTIAPLHTVSVGDYDANGWYVDPAATIADYYNNGQTKTLTYTPNQNSTSLDPSNAFWALQFRNETDGVHPIPNVFFSATVHLSAIADYRQE